ncbi:hypothetical protein [Roseateles amylovorans]|uniref:Lipoprotein n=1 Tax=Roseateles amylovorans TaxID=2978473 RepID=A0ABY6B1P1_9BURK|nr:hypothetical protein [Roseateles amylovorans]UXH77433.1 hypothetical protein N4261_20900 [Roseateles amylovorans]
MPGRQRFATLLTVLCVAAFLEGCASCPERPVQRLSVQTDASFIKTSHNADDFWLDHPGFALSIGPCRGNPAGGDARNAALCAKLFVHEGTVLQFEKATFQLLDLKTGETYTVPMKGQGFKPLEPIVGSDFRFKSGFDRFTVEPGTPEYFRLLEFWPPNALLLAMPRVQIGSQFIDLPTVRTDPVMERRCVHFH